MQKPPVTRKSASRLILLCPPRHIFLRSSPREAGDVCHVVFTNCLAIFRYMAVGFRGWGFFEGKKVQAFGYLCGIHRAGVRLVDIHHREKKKCHLCWQGEKQKVRPQGLGVAVGRWLWIWQVGLCKGARVRWRECMCEKETSISKLLFWESEYE